MQPPNGLDEITELFGDIQPFIQGDGTLSQDWHDTHLAKCVLPFSLPLDWNRSVTVNVMLCHKKMVEVFEAVFQQIVEEGLQPEVKTYGGCFAYRPQRGGTKLSTHAWGISIDLNCFENSRGTNGRMSPEVVNVFRNKGFKWGGDWQKERADPMHFQYATGY
jgi:hypothetical protein